MTMDAAMGLIANIPAKGGERGNKGKPAEAAGFDEVLAAGPAKRMPPQDKRGDHADEAPPQWRIGGLGERLAAVMPRSPKVEDTALSLRDLLQPDGPDTPLQDAPGMPDDALPGAAAQPMQAAHADTDAAPAARPGALAAETQPTPTPRQRGERDRPAQPAPATNALADDDGGETAAPRGRAAATGALPTAGTDVADATETATRARPAPDRQQPVVAAADKPAEEPAGRQARPAAAQQPDGAGEQRPQRPAPVAPRAEAPATADRAAAAGQAAETAQPRVSVLGFSTSAAPALPVQLNPTAAGLVAAIEAEPSWRAAAAEAASAATQRAQSHGSVSTLRIQLNPAELGMVTARLTAAGPQLEIEIRVESSDARQRLASDSDAIVKALRAVGYDIDKVTIQQAPQGSGPAPQQGAQGRDPFLQGGQGQERADANARGRDGQGSGSDGKASRHGAGDTAAERPGGGVYI